MSKITQKYPVLGSSVNPEQISLTVKGIIGGLATALAFFGIILPLGDISPLIDQMGTLVAQIAGVVSTGIALYGGIRRLWNVYIK